MLVTERMQALGDHAKSSRQPPVKERKHAKADESAAKQDTIDETILGNGAVQSAVADLHDVTSQIVVPENGNDGATQADATPEDSDIIAAKRAIIHEWENWSALNSDELDDPNVADSFFRHLQQKKVHLLSFGAQNEWNIVRALIVPLTTPRR